MEEWTAQGRYMDRDTEANIRKGRSALLQELPEGIEIQAGAIHRGDNAFVEVQDEGTGKLTIEGEKFTIYPGTWYHEGGSSIKVVLKQPRDQTDKVCFAMVYCA